MTTATTRWKWQATLAAARGAFRAGGWCWPSSRTATRTRDCFEDFVKVIGRRRRRAAADRGLRRRRGADRGCRRPFAGACCGWPGVEPVFVDDIAAMPQAVLDMARDGDVVMCMGAAPSAVPGLVG